MLTHLLEREAKKAPSDCKMKAKLTILLIALTSGAHGNLFDLTPGGFNINEPCPLPVIQFFNQFDNGNGFQFLAGANIQDGQVVWLKNCITGCGQGSFILNPPGVRSIRFPCAPLVSAMSRIVSFAFILQSEGAFFASRSK